MFLDLYQKDQDAAATIQPGEGHDLPATFGDTFGPAWSNAELFSQSLTQQKLRASALWDYVSDLHNKTGDDAFRPEKIANNVDTLNDSINKVGGNYPDLNLKPLNEGDVDDMAVAKGRSVRTPYEAMGVREKTLGGKIGFTLGGLIGQASDPINLLAAPIAPEAELGVLGSALLWGGVGLGTQAVNEGVNADFRERVRPGYAESGEPLENILEAGAAGAVLGGGTKALSNVWSRVSTGAWPRSVRDAGNIVSSEANVANTNVLAGPEGEVAHRQALTAASDSIVGGNPVDVEPALQGFEAYHGSPHDFDAFDSSKIGTGEGRQAVSYGHYVAENEDVGARYRDRLGGEDGNLYTSRVTRSKDDFLSWEDPLSKQPAGEKILGGMDADFKNRLEGYLDAHDQPELADLTGREFHRLLERLATEDDIPGVKSNPDNPHFRREASEYLASLDVAGVKFLDQGSRNGAGQPTRNFVVFNDHDIRITHKNGQPLNLHEEASARIDRLMETRGAARESTQRAEAEAPAPDGQPALPFEQGTHAAAAEQHTGAIADGVTSMARAAGYDMPRDEAMTIADRVAKADPETARRILEEVSTRPQTLSSTLDQMGTPRAAAEEATSPLTRSVAAEMDPKQVAKTLADPQHTEAMLNDLDKLRATGDRQIPDGVDANGEPTYRSLDAMVDEVRADQDAAKQLEGCIVPAQEAAA